jgi:hypothetical protein
MDPAGKVRFHRPDGTELPVLPPASTVPADPAAELERRHRQLAIEARTPTPRWNGERLDLDYAVHVFAERS